MANSATLTFGYTNTDFTRKYTFNNLSAADCAGLKAKVLALNASIEGGTDGNLGDFFISDDFDATDSENVIGKFNGIVAAQFESSTVTDIPLS